LTGQGIPLPFLVLALPLNCLLEWHDESVLPTIANSTKTNTNKREILFIIIFNAFKKKYKVNLIVLHNDT